MIYAFKLLTARDDIMPKKVRNKLISVISMCCFALLWIDFIVFVLLWFMLLSCWLLEMISCQERSFFLIFYVCDVILCCLNMVSYDFIVYLSDFDVLLCFFYVLYWFYMILSVMIYALKLLTAREDIMPKKVDDKRVFLVHIPSI